MPITCEFEYHKPKTLPEALKLLTDKGSCVLAGGTDLLVWMKEGLRAPKTVVDIKGIAGMGGFTLSASALRIGACVTFSELIESDVVRKKLPMLWECSRTVASVGVRNRATLAGNICSAVPSLDSAPALLVYDAVVEVRGPKATRKVPVAEWFTGVKRTALKPGELVTAVIIPLTKKKAGSCYVKLGRYRGEDLAQVGVAVLALADNEYRVAFCAVGPVPTRAKKIEALLSGKELDDALIAQAKELVPQEISPITDIRSSKEYRLHMARVMLARGLKAACARLAGDAPATGDNLV
ncbi:MAG: xanthine dehydrogenase family protein subunit M [Elusimicrobia bacterium]|nr:xanthine dehydrogenase family protein subunit M [Elusimicrobiota bacterium]